MSVIVIDCWIVLYVCFHDRLSCVYHLVPQPLSSSLHEPLRPAVLSLRPLPTDSTESLSSGMVCDQDELLSNKIQDFDIINDRSLRQFLIDSH